MTSGWSRHVLEVPCIVDLCELSSESLRNPGTGQSVRRRVSGPEEVNQERRRVSRPKEVNQEILESLGWSYLSDSAWLLGSAFC